MRHDEKRPFLDNTGAEQIRDKPLNGGMAGGQSERPTKAASITLALESLATVPGAIEELLAEVQGVREQWGTTTGNEATPAPPVPGLELVLDRTPEEIYSVTSRCHELLKELRTALIG